MMHAKRCLIVLGMIMFGVGACIPAPFAQPTQVQGDPASTALAQTFDAFQTESVLTLEAVELTRTATTQTALLATPSMSAESPTLVQTETPTPATQSTDETPTPTGSADSTLQFTPTASGTPLPTTSKVAGCDWAAFVSDVTIPDGTLLSPGEIFTKTWRLRNRGTCTWTSEYQLIFQSGTQFGETTAVNLPKSVAPQQTVDISVTLKAPSTGGQFVSYWMLRNPSGSLFGYGTEADRPVYVEISTIGQTATATSDVRVMVSIDTNCRSGPGSAYTYLGALLVGENTEVVGRNADGTYWIIRNPDQPTGTCWLWGQYASVSGNIYGLPVYSTPGNLPSITSTPYTSQVKVSVWVDTNCRSGPGVAYTYLGALLVGESAEVVGRNADWTYWIIRNPDQPGGTCWLWGQYATLSGNTSGVPVYSTPILLTATATSVTPSVSTPTGATRITFETGSIGSTIKANLPANKLHTYVLRAEAGQTLTVQLTSKWDLLFSISGADGSVLKSSGVASSEWSGTLTRSQDYYLAIQAVDGLEASYTLQVVIPAK
jgi:uncharacterized protein YraI